MSWQNNEKWNAETWSDCVLCQHNVNDCFLWAALHAVEACMCSTYSTSPEASASHVLPCTLQMQTALVPTPPLILARQMARRHGRESRSGGVFFFCTDTQSDFPPHKPAGVKNLSDKHSFYTSPAFCGICASRFELNGQHWFARKTKKKGSRFPSWLCKDHLYILQHFFIYPSYTLNWCRSSATLSQ